MRNVPMEHEPHESHIFDLWVGDSLDLPEMSNARFAMIRQCGVCGGEDAKATYVPGDDGAYGDENAKAGGVGSRWQDDELDNQCIEA